LLFLLPLLSTKTESGFFPREQKNRNDFELPENTGNTSFCMMVRVDCGFSSLYDNDVDERKRTINSNREKEREREIKIKHGLGDLDQGL
jgi:hypothetical protein